MPKILKNKRSITRKNRRNKQSKKLYKNKKRRLLRLFTKKKRKGGAGKRKQRSPFNINGDLCILPTGSESQYEAFQAVFAYIMAAGIEPPSAYKILCSDSNIELTTNKPIDRISRSTNPSTNRISNKLIYYDNTKPTTHYIAYLNKVEKNPYHYYQANHIS